MKFRSNFEKNSNKPSINWNIYMIISMYYIIHYNTGKYKIKIKHSVKLKTKICMVKSLLGGC